MYNKDGDLKNWFDLLNGTYYKLDNKEKNDDYYYIDKYINPLNGTGKKTFIGGSIFDNNNILNAYTSMFPVDSHNNLIDDEYD